MSYNAKSYWKKRTIRIIGDLEDALLECRTLGMLTEVGTLGAVLRALTTSLREGT